MLFEGGIRVPFCISWPNRIAAGKRYTQPVSALDIFPTALAAAEIDTPTELELDGVDLLPYLGQELNDENQHAPHQSLFWRYAAGNNEYGFAIREGNIKLVQSVYKNKSLLFDLKSDPWETNDLSSAQPETVARMRDSIKSWDSKNVVPRWLDPHGENIRLEEAERQRIIDRASAGEKR